MDELTDTAVYRVIRATGIVMLATAWMLLVFVRVVTFFPLLWLRMLVLPITNFCAVASLGALCIAALIFPDSTLLLRLGLFSFGAFMAGWLYDSLLLFLSPSPIILDSRVD